MLMMVGADGDDEGADDDGGGADVMVGGQIYWRFTHQPAEPTVIREQTLDLRVFSSFPDGWISLHRLFIIPNKRLFKTDSQRIFKVLFCSLSCSCDSGIWLESLFLIRAILAATKSSFSCCFL